MTNLQFGGNIVASEKSVLQDTVVTQRIEREMGKVLRLVLDVLKPHNPSIIQLAGELSELPGVEAVNISIYEIDQRVENAKVTLEGTNLNYDEVLKVIGENGGSVHSIDEVVAGRMIIEDAETPQDALS